MPSSAEQPVRVAPTQRVAEDWALALVAEGLAARVTRADPGWTVWVREDAAERAAAILEAYVQENRRPPSAPEPPLWPGDAPPAAALLVVGALLLFFFAATGPAAPGSVWFERGATRSSLLAGEPWRAVTALTLHADAPHVLSNALAGGLFFTLVFRALGPGLGAALVLGAGILGNAMNATVQPAAHRSVGASTAVFGAVGLLAGLALRRGGGARGRRRRPWVLVAVGLALLAMLGTGGARTDLWAHFFGLGAGGVLGAAAALGLARPPGLAVQLTSGVAALASVVGAWVLAR